MDWRWFPVQATTGAPAAIVTLAVAAAGALADRNLCGSGAIAVCERQAARRAARSRSCAGRRRAATGRGTSSCRHSTRTAGRGRRRSVIGIVHCRSRVATSRMKCPKCGYLGFETTDRCRNCQYDFSLAPFSPEPELTLHGDDARSNRPTDFELPPIKRQADTPSATALDLDRLFGDPEPASSPPIRKPDAAPSASVVDREPDALDRHRSTKRRASRCRRWPIESGTTRRLPSPTVDESALPFDDGPIVPPPARPPLAVRRSTPELPRNRPRTTRPLRTDRSISSRPRRTSRPPHRRRRATPLRRSMELPSLGGASAPG